MALLEIDETNVTNYNFLLTTECNLKFKMWFDTSDGILYGGNEGIEASILMNLVIPRERTDVVKYMGRPNGDHSSLRFVQQCQPHKLWTAKHLPQWKNCCLR